MWSKTEWCHLIRSTLKNPSLLVCMKYLVSVAQEFKVFTVTIKTEEPKVHMTNFLPTDAFMNDPKSDGWL